MGFKTIDEANQAVIDKMVAAAPFLVDVVPAKTKIPELKENVLLHAGPPMTYDDMTDPMQGACVSAILFEEWADDEATARKMLENDEITLIPCHHVNAVGPMGGITSMNMPVLVVENRENGNEAYCQMNEGIGAVMRFGAYNEQVINRLHWMKDVLGPVLGEAIRSLEDGMNVNVLIAKAIAMGDEFHQRNIASSYAFLRDIAPVISSLDHIDNEKRTEVIQFLSDTDQFFLNVAMATGKQ